MKTRQFDKIVTAPRRLTVPLVLSWAKQLNTERPARRTFVNLANVEHVPPFGMLFIGSCLRQYQRSVLEVHGSAIDSFRPGGGPAAVAAMRAGPGVEIRVNHGHGYASHMGLWDCIGVNIGRKQGEASGSSKYLPITRIQCSSLQEEAFQKHREVGDVIYGHAERLAEVLTQDSGEAVENTLSYAIRELMRNVAEHSESAQMWYCAQHWPSKDLVEFAILDEGRGIFESLKTNPNLKIPNEAQAIIQSTLRGVTRTVPQPVPPSLWSEGHGSRWTNAGWGLFVLRSLAEQAGSLAIVSNRASMLFEPDGMHTIADTEFRGTAIRLLLKPSRLANLLARVLEDSTKDVPPSRLTPSMLARVRNSDV